MEASNKLSKRQAKLEKGYRKYQSQSFTPKGIQQQMRNLETQHIQYENLDPTYRKALEWWKKIDQRYFTSISVQDVINKRNLTTSNQIISQFNSQTSPLLTYKQEFIQPFLQSLKDPHKIKVIFKSLTPYYSAAVAYSIEEAIPSYHTEVDQNLNGIKITSTLHQNSMTSNHNFQAHNNLAEIKGFRLDLQEICEDENLCRRIEKINELEKNEMTEIDQEIQMWQWELQRVNQQNHIIWNQLTAEIQKHPKHLTVRRICDDEFEIRKYQDRLLWGTIIRCFEQGFKDKTQKMLQLYKENQKNFHAKPTKGIKNENVKKFFQTDCKICFCSDNNQSNQVIYCDHCNTSFHLACYGLSGVPKEDKYFCEKCSYLKEENSYFGKEKGNIKKVNKIMCQICTKSGFPMKKFGNHMYHVTCLILWNMVEIREGKMELKGSLSHSNIIKMVIEHQINNEECQGCRKPPGQPNSFGMKLKCCYTNCNNYFHPICAYTNGCKFRIDKTNINKIQVEIVCNDHLASRMEQVYLRRYMCNLNDMSAKSVEEFKQIFERQGNNLRNSRQGAVQLKKKYPNRVLMGSRFLTTLFRPKSDVSKERNTSDGGQIKKMLKEVRSKLEK